MPTPRFAWADGDTGASLTCVSGVSAEQLLARWPDLRSTPELRTWAQINNVVAKTWTDTDVAWVAAQTVGPDTVVLWEFVSAAAQQPVVLSALTNPTGRAMYVSANAKTSGQFVYAVDGTLLADASSLRPGEMRGTYPDAVRPAFAEAGVDLNSLWASDCLVAVEHLLEITPARPEQKDLVLTAQINPHPGPVYVPRRRSHPSPNAVPVTPGPAPVRGPVNVGRVRATPARARRVAQPDPGPQQ